MGNEIIVKLRKIGASYALTAPKWLVKLLKWEKGDKLQIEMNEDQTGFSVKKRGGINGRK